MSIHEVEPERLAELFHHYHQALAPESPFGDDGIAETWNHVPAPERNRLIAAARLTLEELESALRDQNSRRYFAKPGEAEWGC